MSPNLTSHFHLATSEPQVHHKMRLKNCFKGWSLVRPSVSLRHMHHCMSMKALEQGLLGLEAAKASDIDDFV